MPKPAKNTDAFSVYLGFLQKLFFCTALFLGGIAIGALGEANITELKNALIVITGFFVLISVFRIAYWMGKNTPDGQ